jgi:ParB family chromosome partitioning protein
MSERKYRLIPMDQIKVLNSRNRDESQFQENVHNIESIGLQKPIVVNEKYLSTDGYYQLVCGEGRYIAFQRLKRDKIPAEIINCDKGTALLFALVENIAKVPPNTMWFANELKRMKDCNLPLEQIAKIAGKSESYVREYIQLVELGEDRLIKGVEARLFPMSFATNVARSSSKTVQTVLMDAFDAGLINSGNSARVRRLIEDRVRHGVHKPGSVTARDSSSYNLKTLREDISKSTEEKEGFVREATVRENRLFALLDSLNTLWKDEALSVILKKEGMAERPELLGEYSGSNESGRDKT